MATNQTVTAFPEPTATTTKTSASVPWASLRGVLKAALRVVSDDLSRVALSSILVASDATKLTVVATDGHRLLVLEMPCEGELPFRLLLEQDSVRQFCKLAPMGEFGRVTIELADGIASIQLPGGSVGLRLNDAQFPPWDQVLPKRRRVDFGRDHGKASNVRKTCVYVGVNAEYLADASAIAKDISASSLEIEVGENELDPIRIEVVGNAKKGKSEIARFADATYVVMPCRT